MNASDRRYEVLIGYPTNQENLQEVAEAFAQATVKCGHFASVCSFHGAWESDPQLANRIHEADVLVLLLAGPHPVLFTQPQLAPRADQPALVFLIDAQSDSLSDEVMRVFRAPHSIRSFSSRLGMADMKFDYIVTLLDTMRGCAPNSGWVRARLYERVRDELDDRASGRTANPFLRRFDDQLNKCSVLNERCGVNPQLKRAVADYFVDFYLERMSRARLCKFFFESGSSIAFLSEVFSSRYRDMMRNWPELFIETNNIVSYLEFALFHQVKVALYPDGPPELKYGATFGDMPARLKPLPPPERPRRLTPSAETVVRDVAKHFGENYAERGIIFMASSGIELAPDAAFPGPHVGSYYNQLFKRAILESGCPTVILVDETKLPRPFLVKSCFPVCDEALTWEEVCDSKPVAVAAAFWDEQKGKSARDALQGLGYNNVEAARSGERPWTMIASNDKFRERVLG